MSLLIARMTYGNGWYESMLHLTETLAFTNCGKPIGSDWQISTEPLRVKSLTERIALGTACRRCFKSLAP